MSAFSFSIFKPGQGSQMPERGNLRDGSPENKSSFGVDRDGDRERLKFCVLGSDKIIKLKMRSFIGANFFEKLSMHQPRLEREVAQLSIHRRSMDTQEKRRPSHRNTRG